MGRLCSKSNSNAKGTKSQSIPANFKKKPSLVFKRSENNQKQMTQKAILLNQQTSIAEFLKKNGLFVTLSIFLAECQNRTDDFSDAGNVKRLLIDAYRIMEQQHGEDMLEKVSCLLLSFRRN